MHPATALDSLKKKKKKICQARRDALIKLNSCHLQSTGYLIEQFLCFVSPAVQNHKNIINFIISLFNSLFSPSCLAPLFSTSSKVALVYFLGKLCFECFESSSSCSFTMTKIIAVVILFPIAKIMSSSSNILCM